MGGSALGARVTPVSFATPVVAGTIGVFGGTFDPIHYAHLAVAEEAAEALGLERVLFIPAGQPPHKPDQVITPAAHRLAMVELAIAGNDRFAVDRLELDRDGPSYTVDTLEVLSGWRPDSGGPPSADLILVLSADAFLGMASWHDPRRIFELARVAVAPREGYPSAEATFMAERFPDLVDRVVFLDGPRMRLSASELRSRSAAGRTLRYLVPDAVAAYIDDHDLYRNPRRTVET
jgi:nicotinate-nucleotide adenylyltransferase